MSLPFTSAGYATNEASLEVNGGGNGVAICQLLIVGRSILVMDIEDPLSLATLPSPRPLSVPTLAFGDGAPSPAACTIDVGQVVVKNGRGSMITGGTLVGEWSGGVPGGSSTVSTSAGNEVAICQRVLFVDMVVIGGTAAGLPAGRVFEPFEAHREINGGKLASCMVEVGSMQAQNS